MPNEIKDSKDEYSKVKDGNGAGHVISLNKVVLQPVEILEDKTSCWDHEPKREAKDSHQ
jgi:hypothetical protein